MGHRFSILLWARIKGFPAAKRLKRFSITVLAHYTTSFSRCLRLPLQCPHHVCLSVFLTPCLTVCLASCHSLPVTLSISLLLCINVYYHSIRSSPSLIFEIIRNYWLCIHRMFSEMITIFFVLRNFFPPLFRVRLTTTQLTMLAC